MNDSYIINSYRESEVVKNFIFELCKNYSIETREFFIHVLYCTTYNLREKEGWVPVCSELITKEWGKKKVNVNSLLSEGLLEIKFLENDKTYSKSRGLSREFRVNGELLKEIDSLSPKSVEAREGITFFNLMTGKKSSAGFKSRFYYSDTNHHYIPEIVIKSMKAIKSCTINYKRVEDYLEYYEFTIEPKTYDNKAWRKFKNDEQCYRRILNSQIISIEEEFLTYVPAFEMQMSGRISEQGGGVQSCTRFMKSLAFERVPGIKNYDLKSSQVWSLIQFFEAASLDISWLVTYLATDKKEYADAVGVSVDCWKTCFLALIMGGSLITKKQVKDSEKLEDENIAILEALRKELETDSLIVDAYCKFFDIVAPLKVEINKWHNWLIQHFIFLGMKTTGGKEVAFNKCGVSFPLWEYKKPNAAIAKDKQPWKDVNLLKRKLAAFYLQGNEATFIHYLTDFSSTFGYSVMSNQHDGLITQGEIPQEAVDLAKIMSGLRYTVLVEKPLSE